MRLLLALALASITALTSDTARAKAMVTVAGGPHAGSYLLTNEDVPCEITSEKPPLPRHQFDVTLGGFTPSKDPKALTLLMVIIPDADLRGANHTFFTSINFGDVSRGTQYNAETRPNEKVGGTGTVTVTTRGEDATVIFDVKSVEGIAYKGSIQCNTVSRY